MVDPSGSDSVCDGVTLYLIEEWTEDTIGVGSGGTDACRKNRDSTPPKLDAIRIVTQTYHTTLKDMMKLKAVELF